MLLASGTNDAIAESILSIFLISGDEGWILGTEFHDGIEKFFNFCLQDLRSNVEALPFHFGICLADDVLSRLNIPG